MRVERKYIKDMDYNNLCSQCNNMHTVHGCRGVAYLSLEMEQSMVVFLLVLTIMKGSEMAEF